MRNDGGLHQENESLKCKNQNCSKGAIQNLSEWLEGETHSARGVNVGGAKKKKKEEVRDAQ